MESNDDAFETLCMYLREQTIGNNCLITTPFGTREMVYADFAASGRSLKCIESYIQEIVAPNYGNTHTLLNHTGRQTSDFRNEARQIVKSYFNATSDDALIFCGSGVTAAVQKFLSICSACDWYIPKDVVAFDANGQEELKPNYGTNGRVKRYVFGVSLSAIFHSCHLLCFLDPIEKLKDPHFKEDRWGSCECTLCGVRLKNESQYRLHKQSEHHRLSANGNVASGTNRWVNPSVFHRHVLFLLDPTAHHSLLLPFKEFVTENTHHGSCSSTMLTFEAKQIGFDDVTGGLSIEMLERELQYVQRRKRSSDDAGYSQHTNVTQEPHEIVVFVILTAASNVTGIYSNISYIAELTHAYEGLVCCDFASQHTHVDLNPSQSPSAHIDCAFFSSHKLLGGPSSPGILILKKRLLNNRVPSMPGGGVVVFVSKDRHMYINNSEEREEAGTPDIFGSIRCGLLYRMYASFNYEQIRAKERHIKQYLIEQWRVHPRIHLIGPIEAEGVLIIPLLIRYGNKWIPQEAAKADGLYLHPYFLVALLNDLFGIQARGGCVCAGPYMHHLLNIDGALADKFSNALCDNGETLLAPGVLRISLHFSVSRSTVEYISRAILWVAENGWKCLVFYTFNKESGKWRHLDEKEKDNRLWLSDAPFLTDMHHYSTPEPNLEAKRPLCPLGAKQQTVDPCDSANQYLANYLYTTVRKYQHMPIPRFQGNSGDLLWFALPEDAIYSIQCTMENTPRTQIISPTTCKYVYLSGQLHTRCPFACFEAKLFYERPLTPIKSTETLIGDSPHDPSLPYNSVLVANGKDLHKPTLLPPRETLTNSSFEDMPNPSSIVVRSWFFYL